MKLTGLLVAAPATAELLCPTSPEIVIIQDASKSLNATHREITGRLGDLLTDWARTYQEGNVRLGFVSFTDKPIPLRGWGPIYATNWKALDTCYDFGIGLTTDFDAIQKTFHSMQLRAGGDLPEAQYEALLYTVLDERIGFTPAQQKYRQTDDGSHLITRIAVVITDDISHLPGDAAAGIAQYNSPRRYLPGEYGGWGSPGLSQFEAAVWQNGSYPYRKEDYEAFWHLWYYYDLGLSTSASKGPQGNSNPYRKELHEFYKKVYGPSSWNRVRPHDGKYERDSCAMKDYPSLGQVKSALDQTGVLPVILVTNPRNEISKQATSYCALSYGYALQSDGIHFIDPDHYTMCVVNIYKMQLSQAGIQGLVLPFQNPQDIQDTLKGVVLSMANYNCNREDQSTDDYSTQEEDQSTEEETSSVTTMIDDSTSRSLPQPTAEPTARPTQQSTPQPTVQPTTQLTAQPIPPPRPTVLPTPEPTAQPTPFSTTPSGDSTVRPVDSTASADDSDTTEESSHKGTIAVVGASAGLAGLALVAGLAYKAVNGNWFGGNSGPTITSVEEAPGRSDGGLDREGLEELTSDMFQ